MKAAPTRERILRGARMLMWTKGYDGASIDEICSTCNVLKGSFYHFFASKEALLIALIERTWAREREVIEPIFAQDRPIRERMLEAIENYVGVQRRHFAKLGKVPGLFYLALNANLPEAALAIVRANTRESVQKMVLALQDLPEHRNTPRAELERRVAVFNYYFIGAHVQARLMNSLAPLETLRDAAISLLQLPPDP